MDQVTYTIFGATGDLSYRKLFPAFYNLFSRGMIGKQVRFLALGRREWSRGDYLDQIRPWIEKFARFPVSDETFHAFAEHVDYLKMQFTELNDYDLLTAYYAKECCTTTHIFYFAVAPQYFALIGHALATRVGLTGTRRVIIEKPFGEDLNDAKEITWKLSQVFGMDNIFHIDHYLGKEMVQSILTLRQKNAIFRSAWDRRSIASVEISALETLDIGQRGGYYDKTGALKDMIQGHLFQILTVFAMEGSDEDPLALQQAQIELLDDLRPPQDVEHHLVLGQYQGYREAKNVAPDSRTETFAALKVYIDNARWLGVPFYLRSGKALTEQRTFIVVQFKPFADADPNLLTIEIQPDERMELSFSMKRPGDSRRPETVTMDFHHDQMMNSQANTPEAYERLLHAAYEGKKEYFSPWMQIEKIWTWMHLLRREAEQAHMQPEIYAPGSAGPKGADLLLARDGMHWHNVYPAISRSEPCSQQKQQSTPTSQGEEHVD